jgi:hypothetical protein
MQFEKDAYHSQGIDKNNMGQVHSERNVFQNWCPNIGIMILFMETHKCLPIMMQIVLVIWMITNPH